MITKEDLYTALNSMRSKKGVLDIRNAWEFDKAMDALVEYLNLPGTIEVRVLGGVAYCDDIRVEIIDLDEGSNNEDYS